MAEKAKPLEVLKGKEPEAARDSQNHELSEPPRGYGVASIQRAAGNLATERAVRTPAGKVVSVRSDPPLGIGSLQASSVWPGKSEKVKVGAAHDPEEHNADLQADSFMASVTPRVPTLLDYQSFFGSDVSSIGLHVGPASERAAKALGARAFTRGRDIHFGRGQFDLHSRQGQRLLAHEIAHVSGDRSGGRVIRRDDDPEANDLEMLDDAEEFTVQTLTLDEFYEQTGLDASQIPENEYVPMSAMMNAAGFGLVCQAPSRLVDLPANTTGVLWEGAHVSDFSRVGGETSKVRGFRAEFMRHAISTGERSSLLSWFFKPLGRMVYPPGATTTLNRGVPGTFANDLLFQYNPRATVVYRTQGGVNAPGFADYLDAVAPEYAGKSYTFSPPKEGTPAWFEAFGEGGCSPATMNCVNRPIEPHRRALGLGANEPVPFVPEKSAPGRFLDPVDDYFFGKSELPPGLARKRIGPAMLAGGAIRVGGSVLLVYGVWHTANRIADAEPGRERNIVIAEEAGGWSGNAVGGVLGNIAGKAIVCAETTGPGAFVCTAVLTIGGSVLGGMAGALIGKDIGEAWEDTRELLSSPKKFMHAAAWWNLGPTNGQSVRNYYEMQLEMADMAGVEPDEDTKEFFDIFGWP